ncbi:hypothetical protein NEDG_02249 [Nematocida displodere]|uniref:RING-type domain-containing protein n=1 Tax=Nematocida displodere TaxID=1805483 RepID=A0A177EG09_9MICR|nr:hypothetical protein NEDG_02249 [Nematocida displodere]
MVVGCSDEESAPEHRIWHIVSPYTKQTIEFFALSGRRGFLNELETTEVDGEDHICDYQGTEMTLYLSKYKLSTIPDVLVQGILFKDLTIVTTGDCDNLVGPVVLEKILKAFGTIDATTLTFNNQVSDKEAVTIEPLDWYIRRYGDVAPTFRCILNNVATLRIFSHEVPGIRWIQERVDLSNCRIDLEIVGYLELENLKLVDDFNADWIKSLTLGDIDQLDSLDCQLLQGDTLPDILDIYTWATLKPVVSDQIIQNIFANDWAGLAIPVSVWNQLMAQRGQSKKITAWELAIHVEGGTTIPIPEAKSTLLHQVKNLKIVFINDNEPVTVSDLKQTLEWVSTENVGLVSLNISAYDKSPELTAFARSHTIEITTNPNIKCIVVCGVDCTPPPEEGEYRKNIVCLSLEAWELFGSGKLADELTRTQTDLSALSPELQAMITNYGGADIGGDDGLCPICNNTLNDFKETNPNVTLCILDQPQHITCAGCLDGLVTGGRIDGFISCPECRTENMVPLVKHRIERNSQGVFVVTMLTSPPALSFPSEQPQPAL